MPSRANPKPRRDRLFDESNLPTRRQLRSLTAKNRSPIRKISPDGRTNDSSRKAAKQSRDASKSRKSRAPTPGTRNDGGKPSASFSNGTRITVEIPPMRRSLSKSSQTDLPADTIVVEKTVEEPVNATTSPRPRPLPQPQIPRQDGILPSEGLERENISTIPKSGPSSPEVKSQKATPILPEDGAQLPEPVVLGADDSQSKATRVHLPPKEMQEQRLQEIEKALEKRDETSQLSIHLPLRDGGKITEALSSPGSTIDAQSATTPAMQDHSTDTSPDNEGSRYDADRVEDKDVEPLTPPDLKPTVEQVAEKEEHDSTLESRMDVACNENLRSSPTAVEKQLLEEQAATIAPSVSLQEVEDPQAADTIVVDGPEPTATELTEKVTEVVQDVQCDRQICLIAGEAVPVRHHLHARRLQRSVLSRL